MPETELFLQFVRPFNRAGIRYVIGGSIAATFYGEPRMTNDVDFVVFLNDRDIRRLLELFPATDYYVPPAESIAVDSARESRGHFNIIQMDTNFKADIYLTGRDEFNAWAFRNKRRFVLREEPVIVAPPEYVIVRKLEFFREGGSEKHLRDIRSMLTVSGNQLDRAALHEWIARQGVQEQWQKVADTQ